MDKPPLSWLPWEGLIRGKSSKMFDPGPKHEVVHWTAGCGVTVPVMAGRLCWLQPCRALALLLWSGVWACTAPAERHTQTHIPLSCADLHVDGWVTAQVMSGGWHEERFKAVLRAVRVQSLCWKNLGGFGGVIDLFPSFFHHFSSRV